MQEFLVGITVFGAILFIARRLWRFARRPDTLSCGCGCSGCDERMQCPTGSAAPFPTYKP